MTLLMWLILAFLNSFLHAFWKALKVFHWLDFLACLYSLALRRTILFRSLLYHGSDFLLLQTLVGMFLSIDFPIPDLKETHKSSTVEEGGALVPMEERVDKVLRVCLQECTCLKIENTR